MYLVVLTYSNHIKYFLEQRHIKVSICKIDTFYCMVSQIPMSTLMLYNIRICES